MSCQQRGQNRQGSWCRYGHREVGRRELVLIPGSKVQNVRHTGKVSVTVPVRSTHVLVTSQSKPLWKVVDVTQTITIVKASSPGLDMNAMSKSPLLRDRETPNHLRRNPRATPLCWLMCQSILKSRSNQRSTFLVEAAFSWGFEPACQSKSPSKLHMAAKEASVVTERHVTDQVPLFLANSDSIPKI
jgi:predicted NAD/FAD-dependent oxidoreductase